MEKETAIRIRKFTTISGLANLTFGVLGGLLHEEGSSELSQSFLNLSNFMTGASTACAATSNLFRAEVEPRANGLTDRVVSGIYGAGLAPTSQAIGYGLGLFFRDLYQKI